MRSSLKVHYTNFVRNIVRVLSRVRFRLFQVLPSEKVHIAGIVPPGMVPVEVAQPDELMDALVHAEPSGRSCRRMEYVVVSPVDVEVEYMYGGMVGLERDGCNVWVRYGHRGPHIGGDFLADEHGGARPSGRVRVAQRRVQDPPV